MIVTDFHTHAFPDSLAARAIEQLESECDEATAHSGGRISDLITSMDRADIFRSVVLNIATKPAQFEPILSWCDEIRSDRIVPFPSVHPQDPLMVERIDQISQRGFKGIKLHPYYQSFTFNDPSVMPLYEALERNDLVLLTHAGFDIAYDRYRIVDPERIREVHNRFPRLRIVASHLGAWQDWDLVNEHLVGTDVYFDVSYTLHIMDPSRARELITRHGSQRVLFGSDSPWEDQSRAFDLVRRLELGDAVERMILETNADRLIGNT